MNSAIERLRITQHLALRASQGEVIDSAAAVRAWPRVALAAHRANSMLGIDVGANDRVVERIALGATSLARSHSRRQLDAVVSRFLLNLANTTPLLGDTTGDRDGDTSMVFVDIDDTIIEVHGHAKQGAGFGYSGVRGLNASISTISGSGFAPVIAASRLRKGNTGSPRGAARLVADTLATVARTPLAGGPVLVRADSAFYGPATISAALKGGADVLTTARMDPAIKRTIATIATDSWTRGRRSNTPTRSSTKRPASGSRLLRSRNALHRLHRYVNTQWLTHPCG